MDELIICRYCGRELEYRRDYGQYATEDTGQFYCPLSPTQDQWHEPE